MVDRSPNNLRNDKFRYAFIVALSVAPLMGYLAKEEDFFKENADVNQDGLTDVVVHDNKNKEYSVFIKREDDLYEKTQIRIQDGIPFFYTKNGWYDPWGSFFGFDGTIKRKDGLIWKLK
ncbi:MAG: hypothetical protein Q7S27_03980 [Nanoarchaeota archaeon]|nr:hypothetical protein [Nanoarchaeota archaeon]